MSRDGAFHLGTSGWAYPEWLGGFYPRGTKAGDFLARYQQRFDAVEVNATFYRLPKPALVERWRKLAPPGFRYAVKAHRLVTHLKKLQEPAEGLAGFLAAVEPLGASLGPILFQLPTGWPRDDARLAALLEALPPGHRYALEPRHESWLARPVIERLERHGVAFCQSDVAAYGDRGRPPEFVTTDLVYLRLHGPDPQRLYQGRYDGRRLAGLARRIARWRAEGRDVWCFFDNTMSGDAPADALRLRAMVEGG